MSVSIGGTTGVTFNDASVQNTAATGFGFKNRLINSAMVIDQRNAGASVTSSVSSDVYVVDRFYIGNRLGTGTFTAQQTTASNPAGYKSVLGITTGTAQASVTTTQYAALRHSIEGLNVADFGWGTANATTVTLSFWVRSSLTGAFGGSLVNAAFNRSYPFTYTISSANVWQQISITIAGDQSGTWATDNTAGIHIFFGLGVGQTVSGTAGSWAGAAYYSATGATSVVGTNGATFYITGVQLEKGSTATSFDYRPYGTELALCQRYYYKIGPVGSDGFTQLSFANITTTTNHRPFIPCPPMRVGATSLDYSGVGFITTWGAGVTAISALTLDRTNYNGAELSATLTGALGSAGGMSIFLQNNNSSGYVALSAEL